jgi:putative ABC transport system permease protein
MIKNYLKTAWRNLVNTKFYSAINIIGLTIGLAVGILILIWVRDELSFDKFNSKAENIYKVNASMGTGASKQTWPWVQGPVAFYAVKNVPEVVSAVRVITSYDYSTFKYKDKILKEDYGNLKYIDNSFFDVFDYQLVKGNKKNLFPNDRSVILTESVSKKYFGSEDAMGKVIVGDSRDLFTVSGVIADFPANSSINADMLFSMNIKKKQYDGKGYWKSLESDWGNYFADTYLLIKPTASATTVASKLTKIHMKLQSGIKPTDGVYSLQSLTDIHLYNADGSEAGIQTVKIFFLVAILILLIACINYVNLSTARALLRSKEVSVRKIIGAERKHLFLQFVVETVLCFFIATILAFGLISVVMPLYNQMAGKQMHFNVFDKNIWQTVGLTVLASVIASSIYPAVLLSSFKPISALKGKISGIGNTAFRKVLVVCQFAFSIGLIIGTLVINKQLNFIRSQKLGYDREYVFNIQLHDMEKHYDAIKADLLTHKEIKGITTGNNSIVSSASTTSDTDWDGKPADLSFLINPFEVDKDFIKLFNIEFAAGQNFSGTKSDSANFILNETAVKLAGIKNPIGKRFKLHDVNGTIIGVVKDFHFASLKQTIAPSVFTYRPTSWQMYVKTTGKDAPTAIKAVEKYWRQYNANFPYEYTFLDDQYNDMYKSEQQTGALFSIFAGIAIFISCLGLFGLATYTAQIKLKEIGIRKVLGASIIDITAMLSKNFLLLVLIAIAIASPITWYAMNKWLQGYAYRTEFQWWIIAASGVSALFIALATISFQSIKAALANPVKSLRSE